MNDRREFLIRAPLGVLGLLADLPGGGSRMIRRPKGVAGVWVNGEQVFDGRGTLPLDAGPGKVLDRFDA